jgi:toluene monooxygenase system ferredoxin subunit
VSEDATLATEVTWHEAASLDELWEGEVLGVEVAGDQVLLAHLPGGEVLAYQGLCPHQEVLLGDGLFDEDTGRLVCGGHSWEFDLRRGESTNPQGCVLFRYQVQVRDDAVHVAIPQDGERHYHRWGATS